MRELLDEALKIFRDAGPQVVSARGLRASRWIIKNRRYLCGWLVQAATLEPGCALMCKGSSSPTEDAPFLSMIYLDWKSHRKSGPVFKRFSKTRQEAGHEYLLCCVHFTARRRYFLQIDTPYRTFASLPPALSPSPPTQHFQSGLYDLDRRRTRLERREAPQA